MIVSLPMDMDLHQPHGSDSVATHTTRFQYFQYYLYCNYSRLLIPVCVKNEKKDLTFFFLISTLDSRYSFFLFFFRIVDIVKEY